MDTFNSTHLYAMRLRELALSVGITDGELSRAITMFAKKGDPSGIIDLSAKAETPRQYRRFWALFRKTANKHHRAILARKDEGEPA
jgi:hypothetical protein